MNKFDPDPSWHLCDVKTEDVLHFLIRCRALTVITCAEMANLQKVPVSVGCLQMGTDDDMYRMILYSQPTGVDRGCDVGLVVHP